MGNAFADQRRSKKVIPIRTLTDIDPGINTRSHAQVISPLQSSTASTTFVESQHHRQLSLSEYYSLRRDTQVDYTQDLRHAEQPLDQQLIHPSSRDRLSATLENSIDL
jgi:hypothetical protein